MKLKRCTKIRAEPMRQN